ncbi:2-keto-4-pentenoate hydratase [Pigmentiphaga aceris]|uniref:2-keto-4-pentenoate hydratase n=1 Tax=Pigmentiphaga aceris TaxID=1940612 RepID=A0A5C0AYP7_9BURK|nr:2-keto-4-pentenoate hydratase [Pigmentiphaga aceris]QEI06010.1 2-keto-4-pentenoate hydratase [Pigmentiphaga aceris]
MTSSAFASQPTAGFDPAATAAVLAAARTGLRPLELSTDLRPPTLADAYLAQDIVVLGRGEVAGWKVGADTPEAEPLRGALATDSVFQGRAVRLDANTFNVIGVEAELVYLVGKDLPPRATPYTEAEVLDAIASVHAGIEIVDTRFAEWGKQDKWSRTADQANHGALIVGEGHANVRAITSTAQPVRLLIDGEVAAEHVGGNSAGDTVRLLVWMANLGAVSLGGLRAGQYITSGSTTGSIFVAQGAQVIAEFPGVGRAELLLT